VLLGFQTHQPGSAGGLLRPTAGAGLPDWLDLDVPDDRFIASTLLRKSRHPGSASYVATGDVDLPPNCTPSGCRSSDPDLPALTKRRALSLSEEVRTFRGAGRFQKSDLARGAGRSCGRASSRTAAVPSGVILSLSQLVLFDPRSSRGMLPLAERSLEGARPSVLACTRTRKHCSRRWSTTCLSS
jgi:hypothetical protein